MYERERYWVPPVNSIQEFIAAASSSQHRRHADIVKTMTMGRGFTWAAHFQPQKEWLRRGTKKNVVIIRYSSNREEFKRRVMDAFAFLGVERQEIPEINVSTRLQNDTNTDMFLSPAAMEWLRHYYRADFKLWDVVNRQFDNDRGPWKAVF